MSRRFAACQGAPARGPQGSDLELKHFAYSWRVNFSPIGIAHSASRARHSSRRRGALCSGRRGRHLRPRTIQDERTGVPGRLPHDFPRAAVRNLERAAVRRSVAMELIGHRTEAMYRRSAIADESMLREAAKLTALHDAEREALPKVYFEGPRLSFDKVLPKSAVAGDVSLKLGAPQVIGLSRNGMVGRDGIEPPTPGFSVPPGGGETSGRHRALSRRIARLRIVVPTDNASDFGSRSIVLTRF